MKRFWSKVDRTGECWLWTAATSSKGYGSFRVHGKTLSAHRVAYILTKGVIPFGFDVDHTCFNRKCMNPGHLEAVLHAENVRRSGQRGNLGAANRRKTHCPQGHEYSATNTFLHNGSRSCKTCNRERKRKSCLI